MCAHTLSEPTLKTLTDPRKQGMTCILLWNRVILANFYFWLENLSILRILRGFKRIKMNNKRNGCRWVYLFWNKVKLDQAVVWLFRGKSSFHVCPCPCPSGGSGEQHVTEEECEHQGLFCTLPICCARPGNFCVWSWQRLAIVLLLLCLKIMCIISDICLYICITLFRSINVVEFFRFCNVSWFNRTKNTCYFLERTE